MLTIFLADDGILWVTEESQRIGGQLVEQAERAKAAEGEFPSLPLTLERRGEVATEVRGALAASGPASASAFRNPATSRVDFHPSFQTLTSIFPHTEARKQAEFERWYFAEEEKKRYQKEQKALREARHGPKVVPALHYTPYTDNVTTLADDAEKKRWPKGSSSAVAPKFTPAPPEDVGYNPQHPTQRKRIFERDDPNDLTSGPLWKWVLDHKSSNESLKSAYGPDETIPESAFRDGSGRDPAVLASAQNAAEQREASAQVDRSVNFTRYYHHPGLTQSLTKHEAPPTEPHSAAGDGHHND